MATGSHTLADVTVKAAPTSSDVTNKGLSIHDNVAGNGDITGIAPGEVSETSTFDEAIAEVTPASGGTTGNHSSAVG